MELLRRNARTVDRTRTAERPAANVADMIGKVMQKLWENIPRLVFGPEFAPRQEEAPRRSRAPEREGMRMGR